LTLALIAVNFAKNHVILGKEYMKPKNNLREIRESKLLSKAELARLAGVSAVTIDRIERGEDCRVETKRKIILALGFTLAEKEKIFHGQ